jgi:uncharacterized protein YndB with AHSA1/START domain
MTGITEKPSATPAEASADYQKTIRVKASPGALFDALTTVAGLTAWWAHATGSGDADGELRFYMSFPEPCVMHVDEATWPTLVRWTVTECSFLPDWEGTRPVFTITAVGGDASDLHFRHHSLTPELDCIEMCTRSWNHFLVSLRDYVEDGRGSPFGSAADKAWREVEKLATTGQLQGLDRGLSRSSPWIAAGQTCRHRGPRRCIVASTDLDPDVLSDSVADEVPSQCSLLA